LADDGGASAARRISVAIANAVDADVDDPDALLDRFHAQTGWARALAEAGARVTVAQRFGRDVSLRRDGVDYRFVVDRGDRPTSRWFWGGRLARAVAAAAPDVVHVQGLVFPVLVRSLRLALPPRAAIVVQDHGGIHAGAPQFGRWYGRLVHGAGLSAADAALFTDRALAAPWLAAGVLTPGQAIHAIPEASTDLHEHLPPTPATPSQAPLPGRPAVLWVGRLDANKDPLTILKGFELASATLPDAALTFVFGEDGLLPDLQTRVAASPALRARVHLRGRLERRELPALYATADVFVLGSRDEGSSFALIEALAFGVTPVVSDIPAFRALTAGGDAGALFARGDPAAFAAALVRVAARNPTASRARVRAHFARELSWRALGPKAVAIYRDVVAARGAATRR
jgi:glycosyltransferase involved in cell wall biosynthesis